MSRPVLVALCAAVLVFNSCGQDNKSPAQAAAPTPRVEVAKVVTQKLAIRVRLPGELEPYEEVAIFPKVTGFVEWILADRGSRVTNRQLIFQLEAPDVL